MQKVTRAIKAATENEPYLWYVKTYELQLGIHRWSTITPSSICAVASKLKARIWVAVQVTACRGRGHLWRRCRPTRTGHTHYYVLLLLLLLLTPTTIFGFYPRDVVSGVFAIRQRGWLGGCLSQPVLCLNLS